MDRWMALTGGVAALMHSTAAKITELSERLAPILAVVAVLLLVVAAVALFASWLDPFGRQAAVADERIERVLERQCVRDVGLAEQLNIREKWFHAATDLANVLAESGVAKTPEGLVQRRRLAARLASIDRNVLPVDEPDCSNVIGRG